MIYIKNVSKQFEKNDALNALTFNIKEGQIFGLVGTNGAGKTTLLKVIAGIYRPDSGCVKIDGKPIYENSEVKRQIFYIADDAYFPVGFSCNDMMNYYKALYPSFDEGKYNKLLMQFGLNSRVKVQNLSKGMKKQVSILLALSAQTKFILMDETFDGLDPVMRQGVKSLLVNELCNRDVTPIIASHNLRELEDICENIGLLHEGKILVSDDMESLKKKLHKVQCVFEGEDSPEVFNELQINQCKRQGSLFILTIRGNKEEIMDVLKRANPVYCEMIPLSLEEMFISETEVVGYEIKNRIY